MPCGNEAFVQLLVEQQARFFAGHIHAHSREGVAYALTSRAGAPLYSTGHPVGYHHFLRVNVWDGEATADVVEI